MGSVLCNQTDHERGIMGRQCGKSGTLYALTYLGQISRQG
jgi:hypothetical protein